MAFWEKLSCQWLHCLSRIVVINFTRTWSTGALPGGGVSKRQSWDPYLPSSVFVQTASLLHTMDEAGKTVKCLV